MSKSITRRQTIRDLEFVCPRCGLDRAGHEVADRRWWSLLGVALLPVGGRRYGVVCRVCEHRYDLDILDVPTTGELAAVLEAATVACVTTIVRATPGHRHAEVGGRAVAMLREHGYDYDDDRLAHAVSTVSVDQARARIRRLRDELTPYGKQGLLHRLSNIVLEGSATTAAHRAALLDVGRALGVGPAHVNGLLAVHTTDATTGAAIDVTTDA